MDKLELVKTWSCSGCFLLKGLNEIFLTISKILVFRFYKLEKRQFHIIQILFINFLGTLSRKEFSDIDVRDHLNLEFSRRVGVKGFAYPASGSLIYNSDKFILLNNLMKLLFEPIQSKVSKMVERSIGRLNLIQKITSILLRLKF